MTHLTEEQKQSLMQWLESAGWWDELPYSQCRELLERCRQAITSVPDKAVFGIGGEGMTHWYLADELLDNIIRVVADF